MCESLGWSTDYDYYIGHDEYLLYNPQITDDYWLTNYNSYVFNQFDSCNDSSFSYSSDICSDCSLNYDSSLCSVSKYSSDQSSIIDNYAFYIECAFYTITTSSFDSFCAYYSTYDSFDEAYSSTDCGGCENSSSCYSNSSSSCYSNSSSSSSSSDTAIDIATVIGLSVFACCVVITCCGCVAFCNCQRRRFSGHGYCGPGSRKYGGPHGWFGRRGDTPAYVGVQQINQQVITTNSVIAEPPTPIEMQGQQAGIMPGEAGVQYIQQPIQGQHIQHPMQGQQIQYVEQPQVQMQQILQPVQYQQVPQEQKQDGYPVSEDPPAYSDVYTMQ